MEMEVYRRNIADPLAPGYVIERFNLDERTVLTQKFLGENVIKAEYTAQRALDLAVGDYVNYNAIRYNLNQLPNVAKTATNQLAYSMTFESEYYDFGKVMFLSVGGQSDFYLMGDLEDFVDLIITNMNRISGAGIWTKGTCTQTNAELRLMHFEGENCRQVMQRLCADFSGEFAFNRKAISFADTMSSDTGLTFQYKSGLQGIERKNVDTGGIITRLYGMGSKKNLGSAYGKARLELNTGGVNYIESNTATYGAIEGSVIFEDVFPRYTGTVSTAPTTTTFTQAGFPFDVNTYLISGVTAKVNFKTGNCAGYTFDLVSYNNTSKLFTLAPVVLENGETMPSVTLHPEAGDTFVLVDITMPASYVTAAESELLSLSTDYLALNDHPRVTYGLTPDWRYMKTNAINLTIGDNITIIDADLGIASPGTKYRIIELSQVLVFPYKYTLTLSDQAIAPFSMTAYGAQKVVENHVYSSAVTCDIGKARRNWKDSEELKGMVFDPDGYFSDSIRPLSIETTMLAAGSKSGMFNLVGVVIKPNYLGSNVKLSITGGSLVHFAIDNTGADNIGTWTLVANDTYIAGGLVNTTAYYLYAKCHKTNYTDGANQIIVDTTAYKTDQTTHWYFLVGILHSTTGTVPRNISLTYGQTLINGGFITTGRISSAGAGTYFDLDNNSLVIGSGQATGFSNFTDVPLRLQNTVGGTFTGLNINDSYMGYFVNGVQTVYIANNGNLTLGDPSSAKGLTWVQATGVLTIRGTLNADDITAGTITGRTLQTGSAGKRIKIDSSDNTIKVYNSTGDLIATVDDDDTYGNFISGNPAAATKRICSMDSGLFYSEMEYTAESPLYVFRSLADNGSGLAEMFSMLTDGTFSLKGPLLMSSATYGNIGINGHLEMGNNGYLSIDSKQVVGERVIDARADDAVTSTWSATEAGVLDALRDAMITHGLIAAS